MLLTKQTAPLGATKLIEAMTNMITKPLVPYSRVELKVVRIFNYTADDITLLGESWISAVIDFDLYHLYMFSPLGKKK